jgi:hypothetical protein
LLLALVSIRSVEAADTGLKTGTVVSAGATWGGTFTTANLNASDDAYAINTTGTASADAGVLSTFGFGIPGGVAISDIEVQVEGSDSAATTVNYSVQLSWNGGANWTASQTGSFTGTADVTTDLGRGTLWRRAWSAAELSDANFRLRIFRTGGAGNLRVDRVQVRVSYYPSPWPAGAMQLRTGSYFGDGTNGRAITGLGFQPDVVIVMADNFCNGLPGQTYPCGRDTVLRTSTMGAGDISSTGYQYGNPPMSNRIQSLDVDGFTVGEPPDHNAPNDDTTMPYHCANHSGTRYYWTAFRAAGGELEIGDYVGDNTASRDITGLSFQPDYVLITSAEGERITHRTSLMPLDTSFDVEGGGYCPGGCPFGPAIRDMLPNGFRIGGFDNGTGETFHYVAWKALPGRAAVGQYTGDGTDNRSIKGTGFRPEYVAVQLGATPPNSSTAVKMGAMGAATDMAYPYIYYGGPLNPTNAIQGLEADGFQVGSDPGLNSLGVTFYWVAFGPGSEPMKVLSGSYIGDGIDNRAIAVGFQPDVVFVKRDENTRFGVVRTSTMVGDMTKSLDFTGSVVFAGGVKSLDASGFTLGTDPNVNALGAPYYWVALDAAPGEMTVGSYTGDDSDNRSIPGVGLQPNYVMVFSEGGFAPVHRTSTMAGDVSYDFNTAQLTDRIQALQGDGFQVGTSPEVNKATVKNHYVAWKTAPGRMAVGSYTGNGGDSRNLNTPGFMPEWALVKRTDALAPWVQKPASTGVNADYSLFFTNTVGQSNDLQQLRPLGFQVGSGGDVNANTITYYWAAFGPHVESYYRSIGTAADYSTGTVAVTNGSKVVTGSGTAWTTANRGRGDRILIGGVNYTIAAVSSQTSLLLTTPYVGATASGLAYTIARQFTLLQDWEDCISFATACTFFPVSSANLVADGRREVGIAYEDSVFTGQVLIDGSTTDATHDITLTADGVNRHYGIAGQGVVIDLGAGIVDGIRVRDDFVTVEWMEVKNGTGGAEGIQAINQAVSNHVVVRYNLLHNLTQHAFSSNNSDIVLDLYNNIMYANAGRGIQIANTLNPGARVRILNNTAYGNGNSGIGAVNVAPQVLLQNNVSHTNGASDYNVPGLNSASSNNLASNGSGATHSPAGGGLDFVPLANLLFASTTPGSENLHIQSGSAAANVGTDLSSIFTFDIDQGVRSSPWDVGADDAMVTTAVDLLSFSGTGLEGAVALSWETGSELRNLGFHLYRSESPDGPFERITSSVVPGLGSSPEGARYFYRDTGLTNGKTYFYELEDIETTGKTTRHGPVSATPRVGAPGSDGSEGSAGLTYGKSTASSLRVLERSTRRMVLELTTEGFSAEAQSDGSVRLSIPGFTTELEPGSPAIPVRRSWVDMLSEGRARVTSVRAEAVEVFSSLRPSAAEAPEIVATREGTVRAGRRRQRESALFRAPGLYPRDAARVLSSGYQGESPKLLLELAPLRWDRTKGELVLAKKLTVHLAFAGGSTGPAPGRTNGRRPVASRLLVREKGLYGATFEQLFDRRGRGRSGIPASSLRMSRLGKLVPFHLEPNVASFRPGSTLYFLSEGASLNPYGADAVYELELTGGGRTMGMGSATPAGQSVEFSFHTITREENRYYQAGLVEAEDLWMWDVLLAPETKSFPFEVAALAPTNEASRLEVWIQGVSDLPESPDHHLRLSLNGTSVAESTLDGKTSFRWSAEIPPGVLREGENDLQIENAGDTGAAYSMVMLNRFTVSYPRLLVAEGGKLEGRFDQGGTAEVSGLASESFLLDVSDETPRWLTSAAPSASTFRFEAEAGRDYLVVSPGSVLVPGVRSVPASRLRSNLTGADYLVLGPRALLEAAQPLLDWRRRQGLRTRAVSTEDVYSEFGFGEARPEAVREFLSFAYHSWRKPALRYVLLLGDASYDFKDYLQTGVGNQVPPLMVKTSYLWTASDLAYAAVNGEDILPDVAIGRLPAANADEARGMVEKILEYEANGANGSGAAVLVADDPDSAGNFEADAEELASGLLASRNPRKIYMGRLGSDVTRREIVEAFDQGASLVSYLGHGGIHLWANENVLDASGVAAMSPQSQQPIVLTLNCLNGYFHFPYFNSLAEELVKAEDKGAIAAFSPSGLSLNDPARIFHKALLAELLSGKHSRIGDAVLAAQAAYAETGAFPELLRIYHLLGDPALKLQ